MELLGSALLIAVLYALSGIMSGSEIALFSLKPHDIDILRKKSPRVVALVEKPRRLLVIILTTNLIVNTLAASIMESLSERFFAGWSVVMATILGTLFVLVFGEVGPKTFAMKHNIGFSIFTAPIIRFLDMVERPFVVALLSLTRFFARRFEGGPEEAVTEEDIKFLVSHHEDMGALDRAEERWIHSIFELDKKRANDLMTPRAKVFALPRETDFDKALEEVRRGGYSRVPLYSGSLDQITGVLHARDLLTARARDQKPQPARLARQPVYVPRWTRCDLLLAELRSRRTHLAVVVDEFGNTAGIITLEDILEAIVGDIRDHRQEKERQGR